MVKVRETIFGLGLVFVIRFFFSTLGYNADIDNHQAWIKSVERDGWSGLYQRDMGTYAAVNYPPLALYSFILTEKAYQTIPENWRSENLHAAYYKLPGLLADLLIGYLLGVYMSWRAAWIFWLNPALWYNSVVWGQIESLSALTGILIILAVIGRKTALMIFMSAVAILTKQNVLPLLPIVLWGMWDLRPKITRIIAITCMAGGMILLAYSPMIPGGENPAEYIVTNYLATIGGQSHQHLASVNALNFWYALGQNNVSDMQVREISWMMSVIGIAIAWWILKQPGGKRYQKYWRATCVISLWTFIFATRMHERHSYMMIAYLTWIYPYFRSKWEYWVITGISWYNVWAVWAGYFWLPLPNTWDTLGKILAVVMSGAGLKLVSEMLHQDGVKAQIVDGSQTKNTTVMSTP